MNLTTKYAVVSVAASSLDFGVYFVLITLTQWPAGSCTLLSASCGGVLSWMLNQYWVFQGKAANRFVRVGLRYLFGIFLGIALNAKVVWLLCDYFKWPPMPGRVTAALSVWFVLYLFNRHVVFR